MSDTIPVDRTKCRHYELTFSSGGQYLTCSACGQRYAVMTHGTFGMMDHGYYNINLLHGDQRVALYAPRLKEE